ncbi:MAG: response regulator [Candidatus Saccharibacteria bacterium]
MAKVLLVEDDNNLREIYQARLTAEGYDIVTAQNGEEALVVAKQNKPDLIISDVMMPRISGFEMLDILRNTDELKHTKVIMLTALGQAEDQKRADNLGADKYLVKSQVTLEDIVEAAKELLAAESTPAPTAAALPTPPAPAPAAAAPVPAPAPAPAVNPTATPATVAVVAEPPAATAAAPVISMPEPVIPPPPAPPEPAVPASVVPQPDTTVVVPPAPANPQPITVTTVAALPEPETAAAPAASAPAAVADAPAPAPAAALPTPPPAPEPAPVPAAETAVTNSAGQTLEAEEAALQAQIENYSNTPAAPTPEVDPATTATATTNDQAIAEAVAELNTPVAEEPLQPPSVVHAAAAAAAPAPPPAPPEPVVPAPVVIAPAPAAAPKESPADSVPVAGKKVIQPINDSAKPDLNDLLAKEEAKVTAPPAAPVVNGTAASVAAPSPAAPGQSFDPNSVAL